MVLFLHTPQLPRKSQCLKQVLIMGHLRVKKVKRVTFQVLAAMAEST